MKRRIFLFSALLAAIAVIATSILVTMVGYDDYFEGIKKEVAAQTSYIRAGYELIGENYLHTLNYKSGHRLTVISREGAVLYDSAGTPEQMDNHLNRPEVREALVNGTGESTRYSDTIREQTYYYAVLLTDGSVLRFSSTTASILASYDQLFWTVALIAVLVFFVSAFIASLLTRRIVKPVNNLDLEHPENNEVYDELIPLLKRIKEQRGQIDNQIRELDRGRREFSAITENMSEGFLVIDRNGKVLSYNNSALLLLDTQSDSALGSNILAFNRSDVFRELVQKALTEGVKEQVVNLGNRQCQVFINPVFEEDAVQGAILLLLDVTEKQERETLRREFTANVSHELKTPLTVISGYAEIMANGIVGVKDIPEFSEKIYGEAQRLIALVNDLMLLSGLEENTQLVKQPVDLLQLSVEAVGRLTKMADGHSVTLSASGERVTVNGISSVLDEMVFNLLENAIKYNRENGNVIINVKKEDNMAVLTVADSGIGVPKSEQQRIFERFYRVDKSHSKTIPGTGLGLSIVKHGALLHGADIEIISNGRTGTSVLLKIPISD